MSLTLPHRRLLNLGMKVTSPASKVWRSYFAVFWNCFELKSFEKSLCSICCVQCCRVYGFVKRVIQLIPYIARLPFFSALHTIKYFYYTCFKVEKPGCYCTLFVNVPRPVYSEGTFSECSCPSAPVATITTQK